MIHFTYSIIQSDAFHGQKKKKKKIRKHGIIDSKNFQLKMMKKGYFHMLQENVYHIALANPPMLFKEDERRIQEWGIAFKRYYIWQCGMGELDLVWQNLETLGTASKPNRRFTGGSVRFRPVSIVLNNDNRTEPDRTAGQPAVGFWSRPLAQRVWDPDIGFL